LAGIVTLKLFITMIQIYDEPEVAPQESAEQILAVLDNYSKNQDLTK